MPENARKKQGESIKLPLELQEALRREMSTYLGRGEKAPTRGELLLKAWNAYHHTLKESSEPDGALHFGGSTDIGGPNVKNYPKRPALGVESQSQTSQPPSGGDITPGEWKWVLRFLQILRSGTVASRAIKWNVLTFVKGLGTPDESQGSQVARPRLSPRDLERIHEETRIIEQTLDAEEAARYQRDHPRKRSSGSKG